MRRRVVRLGSFAKEDNELTDSLDRSMTEAPLQASLSKAATSRRALTSAR